MCGIAGGMMKSGVSPDLSLLKAMQSVLRHRGPDGEGLFAANDVGLVHTRLAIVDVDKGQQPLVSPTGVALVANGEIYNDLDLRASLQQVSYLTDSDSESILQAYVQHGLRFVHHLRGMYAVAIYDPRDETLVLARDPFGIKPLYYVETQEATWFASESHVFAATGLTTPDVYGDARDQLSALQFTCGDRPVFKGVMRVAPGETVVVKGGRVVKRQHVSALAQDNHAAKSRTADFEAMWMDAVDVHRRSDVPYGLFLSGGTDSAAVLAAMSKLEDQPVVAYTAGFAGTTVHDERDQAARVAQAVGADHRRIEVTSADFWRRLPAIAQAMDDPAADYAIVPTYLLAEAAAKDVKVVLTGEGGDEILGGYGRYRAGRRPWPFRKKPWSRHILARAGVLREPPTNWRSDISLTEEEARKEPWSRLQQMQAVDVADWLPNDLLTKLDRCLMAHGVEGRVPFLDGPFARFAFHLPDDDKIEGRLGKMALRRWLEKVLPDSRPFARKRGFSVPVGTWISEQGAHLGPLVAQQVGVGEFCKPEAVTTLFQSTTLESASARWVLLFYALWHQCHIVGADCAGAVQEVLAQKP